MTRTLFIVPHMDDEAISCGGMIRTRVEEFGPRNVMVLAVYGRVYDYGREINFTSEEEDFHKARDVLGYAYYTLGKMQEGEPAQVGYYAVLEGVEKTLMEFAPQEVIVPDEDDLNQDHRFLAHVCAIALRPANLGSVMRVMSFLGLDGRQKKPQAFVPMTERILERKIEAVNCYRREARQNPHPRSPDNIRAQARVWGAMAGYDYAEAYRVQFERFV